MKAAVKPGLAGSQKPESFVLVHATQGWLARPAEPATHPLLARLFGHPEGRLVATEEDLRTPLDAATLEEAIALVRDVGQSLGIAVRVCGAMRTRPTVQLWRTKALGQSAYVDEEPGISNPFERLAGSDAAHWGVSDFYPAHEAALRAVLAGRDAFTTSWYFVKKDSQSACVHRPARRGSIYIEVAASMDDLSTLIDTALWDLEGRTNGSRSGFDVLLKLGLPPEVIAEQLEGLRERLASAGVAVGASERVTLKADSTFEEICKHLDALASACEGSLLSEYAQVEAACKAFLAAVRADSA